MSLQSIQTNKMNSDITVKFGNWADFQTVAQAIRTQVFVVEQKIPAEIEWDVMDNQCVHAIAYNLAGEAIGTGRLLPDGHIGRMAVLESARGLGVGAAILRGLMEQAKLRGHSSVQLNSQISAEEFYRRQGFVREGDLFEEAGIVHIHMASGL